MKDLVNGVVLAGEGFLSPGGGGPSGCLGLPQFVCGDGPNPSHGPRGWPAALDPLGQAEHGQFQVVARPP